MLPPTPPPQALGIFELDQVPEDVSEVNSVFSNKMKHAHPDKNFNSPQAKEYTQKLLAARAILLKQLNY